MLHTQPGFVTIAEINPPELPNNHHRDLAAGWDHVLVTDNVFGKIRMSPYAHAARLTHDTPTVSPTVVVSTRDRNILAIESEVRGAIGNGVGSFLVVVGDTAPHVDHLAHHYEIVEHLTGLQHQLGPFEVGIPTRFAAWQFRRRVDLGAQFLVAGPVMDPATIEESLAKLERQAGDPPVFVMLVPPFSTRWVDKAERFGSVPATDQLKAKVASLNGDTRGFAWDQAHQVATAALDAGCAGVILTGVKHDTAISEGAHWAQKVHIAANTRGVRA